MNRKRFDAESNLIMDRYGSGCDERRFIWFVLFIWLNQTNPINRMNDINQMNQTNQMNQITV